MEQSLKGTLTETYNYVCLNHTVGYKWKTF